MIVQKHETERSQRKSCRVYKLGNQLKITRKHTHRHTLTSDKCTDKRKERQTKTSKTKKNNFRDTTHPLNNLKAQGVTKHAITIDCYAGIFFLVSPSVRRVLCSRLGLILLVAARAKVATDSHQSALGIERASERERDNRETDGFLLLRAEAGGGRKRDSNYVCSNRVFH